MSHNVSKIVLPLLFLYRLRCKNLGVAGQVRKLDALGDDSAVFGNVWIEDNYSNGHIVTVGQISGTGIFFIGYGVKPSKLNPNVYVSTTPINIKRTIFVFDLFGIRVGSTSGIVAVDVGNEVAISFS